MSCRLLLLCGLVCKSADLFQISSVLAYSCNPQCLPIQHPLSLPILTHLEASKNPSIPDCRNPLLIILKGVTGSPSRGQQGSTGVHRGFQAGKPPSPTCSLLSPWALKLMLPPAQECQLAHLGTLATPASGSQGRMLQIWSIIFL